MDPQPPHAPPSYPQQALPYHTGWEDPYQGVRDAEHLRTLAICHYVCGGLTILLSMCGIFYLFMGAMMLRDPASFNPAAPADRSLGLFFTAFGGVIVGAGWLVGALTIYSGRCIARRRRRVFSLVMAGVNCPWIPIGTVLGVFTFVVLMRESVRRAYLEPLPAGVR